MEQHNSETTVFKPRYSIGHWVQLFTPVAILLPQIIIRWFGRMDQDYWLAASPAVSLAYGLLAMLWVLEILIFLASNHIKSIRVHEKEVVLVRPLGRIFRADISQTEWMDDRIRLGHITYTMSHVRNTGELVNLLPAESLEEKPEGQGWFRRLEASRWYNGIVILAVLAIAGLILGWGILKLNGAFGNPPEIGLRELNWLLALVDCMGLIYLIKLLV